MTLKLSLRELEVFVAVAGHGTVTEAASKVALTQSAASQALQMLQQGLGVALFDRVGRRLQLNEHGRLLLPRARAMLASAQEMQNLVNDEAIHLRLGASTTIANYLLPARLAAFRQRYRQSRVQLQVGNTQAIVDAVATFQVDMGLIEGPCHHAEIVVTPWQEDELVVVVAGQWAAAQGDGPLGLASLVGMPWIVRETGSGTREVVEQQLFPVLGSVDVAMELGDSEAIKHTVAAGLGVSCLSRHVVADLLANGKLAEVRQDASQLRRPLFCIRHRDKAVTRGMDVMTAI